VSETKVIGGLPRQVRVVLDTQRLAAYGMTAGAVTAQLQQANARTLAGSFAQGNQEFQVEAGRFLGSAEDLKQVVVGVYQGRPVYPATLPLRSWTARLSRRITFFIPMLRGLGNRERAANFRR